MFLSFLVHAHAVVAEPDLYVFTRLNLVQVGMVGINFFVAGFDSQFAAIWHGISGVYYQVKNDILKFTGICFYRPQIVSKKILYLYFGRDRV